MVAVPPTERHDERILIVAPIGRDAALLSSALRGASLSPAVCAEVAALVAELDRGAGAIILTEEVLDRRALAQVGGALAAQPAWSDLSVVVLTSADRVTEPSALTMKGLEALGNVTLLERPVRVMTLVSTAQSALRARRRQYEVRDHLHERERIARELRERAEHTDAANRAKDEFLAMLGHELRNPIASIVTAIGVLDHLGGDDMRMQRAREVIVRQAGHLGRLVDDLLDVSRVTTGRIVLNRRPIELGASVARSVSTLLASRGRKRHDVSVSVEPLWVDGDETRLEQVVTNLVGNALKYTPEDGVIRVRVTADGSDAVLRVEDSGIGLPPALLPRVFDLFVQGDRGVERATGGLGIGLTLVRRLVELHGGNVQAASEGVDRGSVFTVRLPLVPAPAAPAPLPAADGPAAARTVLLVEDNEDAREMLRYLLKLSGHEVYEAADGLDGLAAAAAVRPDVAIVDVGLPGLDGYEVARRIRLAPHGDRLTLIALTGYGQPEDRQRALEAGFDHFLVKPVDPEQLQAAVLRSVTR
jgi:two-component system, sensor histidine kinase